VCVDVLELAVAYSESEPGIVGNDSKDVIDARDD
jgi:hypothetical protein